MNTRNKYIYISALHENRLQPSFPRNAQSVWRRLLNLTFVQNMAIMAQHHTIQHLTTEDCLETICRKRFLLREPNRAVSRASDIQVV